MSIKIKPYQRNGKTGLLVDIVVELPSGERVRERKKSPLPSRSATQRWAEDRVREIYERSKRPAPKPLAPTLAEFQPTYLALGKADRQKPSTGILKKSIFRVWLIPRLGSKRLDEITTQDIASLKADLAVRGLKHTNNVLMTLGACLRAAVGLKVISELPCEIKLLKVPKKTKPFFDFDDYEHLVEVAKSIDPRTHLVVLLGAEAGLRKGEIVAFEQADVDYKRGFLTVRRTEYRGHVGVPKGGHERQVEMTSRLAAALKAYRHLRGDRLLYNEDGTTITEKIVWGWIKKAVKRAGLTKGTPHTLRHTFCSHLAMRGAPAKAIQELAGHADLSTTLGYMHLSPAARQSAIDLLERRSSVS